MKYRIANPKRTIIMASIIVMILEIILLILCHYLKPMEQTVAKLENMEEERIIEEIDGDEYSDIIEEEQEEENKKEQDIIEQRIENNEVTNNKKNTTNTTNTTNTVPYYIKINYGAQVVTIYKKDEKGNYTIPIKAMVCSTGVATPTSGVYSIKERWEWLGLQGDVYGHYSTQIKGNILFHSVPYLRKGDSASLEYWEYDKLGTYASAGCIRLMVKDAKWIYENCARGTKVEFYSSSNPGPLGKPSVKKISTYPNNLRNWDPTDSNTNNPWLTYKETTQTTPKNEIIVNIVQNNTLNEVTNSDEHETGNMISNEIESTKNNIIVNKIEDNITNEQQNEINKEIEEDKQNTIEKDNKVEKLNSITM